MREIDEELRDILAPTIEKVKILKDFSLTDRGNEVSILVALDLPINELNLTSNKRIIVNILSYRNFLQP
ncbi:hypothetical protein [Maribacter sp. ACAM166]|uniref:hypothetical protein n=1 Tax=Maribacter sp. ACAM166 TaxID=2508996 RepID=UPI0010FEE830|nr:hypothetical protein [Maribacter sp. ACAM166]TLP79272.1 hypothetical protein ES765_10950 [Maribacter sp. ACAM166]